jgi:hypothetical protein
MIYPNSQMEKAMTATTKTNTESEIATARASVSARIEGARETAARVGGALGTGGKAYVAGVLEIGRTFGGFGREIVTEAGEHVRATVRAKTLREVGELQLAWTQHRVEMAATHAKELADLARAKSEEAIAPVAALLRQDKAS